MPSGSVAVIIVQLHTFGFQMIKAIIMYHINRYTGIIKHIDKMFLWGSEDEFSFEIKM